MPSAARSITPKLSMGLIEAIGTLECCGAGSVTPANAGTLCTMSESFCCSTGLFGRAKASSARNRPIEQKAKPVKKRGVKKAELETSFLFIRKSFCSLNAIKRRPAKPRKSSYLRVFSKKDRRASRHFLKL